MAHQLLLLRLIEEESLGYAVSYEHRLQLFLADEARAGAYRDVLIDISVVLDSLRRDLDHSRRQQQPPQLPAVKAPLAPLAVAAVSPVAKSAAAPRLAVRKGGGKGGAVAAVLTPTRKRLCLKHDPRAGKVCKDPKCMTELEHLDTMQPFLAEQFDKASAAFAAGEARRATQR
jgi:hypothetical protein